MRKILVFSIILCLGANNASAGDTPSPAGAKVYFVNLKDGQKVKSPFTVVFGLRKMGVAPAGVDSEQFKEVGHHHLLIDTPLTDEIIKEGIPSDNQHVHYGKGQTEAEVTLPKGVHKLRLVFADPSHVPHNPVVASDEITINVE
jgi:hypothetical protein